MDNYLTALYRNYFKYLNKQKELLESRNKLQTEESAAILEAELVCIDEMVVDIAGIIQKYLSTSYTKN